MIVEHTPGAMYPYQQWPKCYPIDEWIVTRKPLRIDKKKGNTCRNPSAAKRDGDGSAALTQTKLFRIGGHDNRDEPQNPSNYHDRNIKKALQHHRIRRV